LKINTQKEAAWPPESRHQFICKGSKERAAYSQECMSKRVAERRFEFREYRVGKFKSNDKSTGQADGIGH
jgi:hypothetical protein